MQILWGNRRENFNYTKTATLTEFLRRHPCFPSCNLSSLLCATSKRERLTSPSCVGQALRTPGLSVTLLPILITAYDKFIFKSMHCKLLESRISDFYLSPIGPNKNAV